MDVALDASSVLAIQKCRILVVGDLMLDQFIDGEVSRISPEAPVPILRETAKSQMPGGAGNVARNLAALGCNVKLIGVTGQDETMVLLKNEISSYGNIDFLPLCLAERPTTLKKRFRAGRHQILRVDDENTAPLNDVEISRLIKMISDCIEITDLVVLSDYAKGCLPPNVIAKVVQQTKSKRKIVIADPKLSDLSAYSGVDVLTPNLVELERFVEVKLFDLNTIATAASKAAKQHNIGLMVTTLSERGILVANQQGLVAYEKANALSVFDVSGAGDTVVAAIAAALAAGLPTTTAVRLANLAAGIAVAKSGTAIVKPEELIAKL